MKTFSLQTCDSSPTQGNYGFIRLNPMRASSNRIVATKAPTPPDHSTGSQMAKSPHHILQHVGQDNSPPVIGRTERLVNSFSVPFEANNHNMHFNVTRSNSSDVQSPFKSNANYSTPIYSNQLNQHSNGTHRVGHSEDHGVDVGRTSPSGSSSDSRKSRYSSASLDSGRGSDVKTGQFKRISVHSCDSIGSASSNKDISTRNSSSSSSLGSGISSAIETDSSNLNTPSALQTGNNWTHQNGGLTIAEMVLHGITDTEIIQTWLAAIHFEEYATLFINAGYDMPTISRMTPEDLTAIGITKPLHRRALKVEIQRLNIADGIPSYKPNSLLEWLTLLRLEEYFKILCQQGYDSVDRVTELAWEDLEEVGIRKLGHQKKLMLAIKKIQNLDGNKTYSPLHKPTAESLHLPLNIPNIGSCPNVAQTASNYQVSMQHCQEVPIKTYPQKTSSAESPTANLKTFQQPLQMKNPYIYRQFSDIPNINYYNYEEIASLYSSVRGRSLESLEYSNGDEYTRDNYNQRNSFHPNLFSHQSDRNNLLSDNRSYHGYETDSELSRPEKNYSEFDGTVTLNRPKNLMKCRPIAKIAAKTRPDFRPRISQFKDLSPTDKPSLQISDGLSMYSSDSSMDNYGTLKRRKTPPPPPKRTNSIKSNLRNNLNNDTCQSQMSMRSEVLSNMQDQAFATCVKSLASRFSMATQKSPPSIPMHNTKTTPKTTNSSSFYDSNLYDFPPPPSPLLCNYSDVTHNASAKELSKREVIGDREATISSSSSTESMPFANDNVGTIKHKDSTSAMQHSPIKTPSPVKEIPSDNGYGRCLYQKEMLPNFVDISPQRKMVQKEMMRPEISSNSRFNGKPQMDQLDDIETMLVNLSNQLDMMLVSDNRAD